MNYLRSSLSFAYLLMQYLFIQQHSVRLPFFFFFFFFSLLYRQVLAYGMEHHDNEPVQSET
jgi:hypothetical protein